jgi:hypothetical protein
MPAHTTAGHRARDLSRRQPARPARRVRLALAGMIVTLMSLSVLAAPQVAHASQGWCTTAWTEGFNLGSCISDQGTGTVGYPDAYINYVPSLSTCDIHIQVWDLNNTQYSDQQVPCTGGHHVGAPAGPVGSSVNLHAYARLDLNGTHFAVGDSPSFRVNGCTTFSSPVTGFNIGVCVNNQGTGNTAYPDIYVNSTPFPGSCAIQVQVWDDNNHQQSGRQVSCTAGAHDPGVNAGPYTGGATVHTNMRLDLNGGHYAGPDSPAIALQSVPAAVVSLITALQSAQPARYAMKDTNGTSPMDTAKIIRGEDGAYYAVYSPNSHTVLLATSPDLTSTSRWVNLATLDDTNASQPYLAWQADGSYVLADEYNSNFTKSTVKFIHYPSLNALRTGSSDRSFLTDLSFGSSFLGFGCREGTPDIHSTDPNNIQVGFHWNSTCDFSQLGGANHLLDREAYGTLTGFGSPGATPSWTATMDTARDAALTNAGWPGKHGGRDDVIWSGTRLSLGEAKYAVDDDNVFTSWRLTVYDYANQKAYPLTLNLPYKAPFTPCVGNPKASAMTDSRSGASVLVVTAFFFSECAPSGKNGELMYVIPAQ